MNTTKITEAMLARTRRVRHGNIKALVDAIKAAPVGEAVELDPGQAPSVRSVVSQMGLKGYHCIKHAGSHWAWFDQDGSERGHGA